MVNGRISRRAILKGGAAFAATAVAGFPTISRAQDTVKIGFLTALTGLETILGETLLNCFTLAVDEINAKGGIGGGQLQFLVEDDETTTKRSISKDRTLISQDNVAVRIGMISSLEKVAARSLTTPAKQLL